MGIGKEEGTAGGLGTIIVPTYNLILLSHQQGPSSKNVLTGGALTPIS